jgi:hypothetical protein
MLKYFYLLVFISIGISAQQTSWFPEGLNIQPFTANFLEPKAGFSYLLSKSELRLDIGTSKDIFLITDNDKSLSLGADFFTYTRLRGEKEFHFPVDAIDYLFGINAGYRIITSDFEFGARFRLSHISAHFVDGHFDTKSLSWRDGRQPRVYSREFFEFFPYIRKDGLRAYLGLTYLFNSSPSIFGKGIYQIGFDYYLIDLFSDFITPFAAYDLKVIKIDKYSGSNIFSIGFKFGKFNSKGFSLIFSYFSGKSIHGEYFDVNEKYSTFGFNMDL